MERLPPSVFGRTLRSLIRAHWSSQSAYAQAIGVSDSWIAKVVRGTQESVTYATLERLLTGFTSSHEKKELYQSWLETFAPSPLYLESPAAWSSDEVLIEYALNVHNLISAGAILPTYQALNSLWHFRQDQAPSGYATLSIGSALVEAANHLDRIDKSLEVAAQLQKRASSSSEPALLATTLWQRGVTLRHLRPRRVALAEAQLTDLQVFLDSWQPSGMQSKERKKDLGGAVQRDLLLAGLDTVKEGHLNPKLLTPQVIAMERNLKELDEPDQVGLATEVLARALCSMGEYDRAMDCLSRARPLMNSKVNELKLLIGQIQIFLAIGKPSNASKLWEEAANLADQFNLIHHRIKLGELQLQIHRGR